MKIPRATYRLQFHREFGFADATALVPYLAELGISHIYASPWLKARPGSRHGYDIVDHNRLNPDLGSDDDFTRLSAALADHHMGHLADIVPNHMGIMGSDNAWWQDVLENGRASRYADYFDIDWTPPLAALDGRVLVPILADSYGDALQRGEIALRFDAAAGAFAMHYLQHRLPLDPKSYATILRAAARPLPESEAARRLVALAKSFALLPARDATAPRSIALRRRRKERLKRELAAVADEPQAMAAIAGAVAKLNGRPGDVASFDALHGLLEAQPFRLTYWRVAADDINYRRFFDINELAAIRAEEPEVFEASHRLLLRLLAEGKIDALRIDHPDGLYDPKAYFERLQVAVRSALLPRAAIAPRRRGGAPPALRVYTVVEKILADGEALPADWLVQGTTGYRFANMVNGLWVDSGAKARIDRVYSAYIGQRLDFRSILNQAKLLIMTEALASDLNLLAHALVRIAEADRNTRDLTFNSLRRALLRYTAALPVYRTYVDDRGASAADIRTIESAIGVLRDRHVGADTSTLDFLHSVLTGSLAAAGSPQRRDALRFARRLQQFTAPVMAKAMEDTSFYVYNRLASLNEVGGDPRQFGISVAAFHAAAREGQRQWPAEMLATSTHDNKRSEDVRARIDVLSELPALWRLALRRWTRLAARYETSLGEMRRPDRNDQYLFYQTLLGIWPAGPPDNERLEAVRTRLKAYMQKAVREAKVHTSWVNPNRAYETALASFIDGLLGRLEPNAFLQDFLPLSAAVARCGLYNSLAQTLLKLTAPGVPDIYQGNELWDFSLVDPDNRRAVDYTRRRALLRELRDACGDADGKAGLAHALFASIDDGRLKMYVIWRTLDLRARRPGLFERGRYLALPVVGAHAAHIVACARIDGEQALLTIVPRLLFGLTGGATRSPIGQIWEDTRVLVPSPLAACRDVLTGAPRRASGNGMVSLPVAEIFDTLPAALLEAAVPARYAGGSRLHSAM